MFLALLIVSSTTLKLSCPVPCQSIHDLLTPYAESINCSKALYYASYCETVVMLNYRAKFIEIQRKVHEKVPSYLDETTSLLTELQTDIELDSAHIETALRHICNTGSNCVQLFLLENIDKYRLYSYTALINALNQLLIRNRKKPIIPWPIICLNKDGTDVLCLTGKCFARALPVSGIEMLGCSTISFKKDILMINIPNIIQWNIFEFFFECTWTMCNTNQLANDLRRTIIQFYHQPDDKLLQTTMISQTEETKSTISMISTSTLTSSSDATTLIRSYSNGYKNMIYLSISILLIDFIFLRLE